MMPRPASATRLRRSVIAAARAYGRLLGTVLSVARRLGAGRFGDAPAATAGVLLAVHLVPVTIWLGPLGFVVVLGGQVLARERQQVGRGFRCAHPAHLSPLDRRYDSAIDTDSFMTSPS